MKARLLLLVCLAATATAAAADDADPLDRLGEALSYSARHDTARFHLSGLLDLEEYVFDRPAPGLMSADGDTLFNPRLSLFLDGQLGAHAYVFAQARADRGFDPGNRDGEIRLDEYALRLTPGGRGALNFQLGKFATIVGNWVPRHDSWSNPFVTAPLPYENVTGIFDHAAASSPALLLKWANLGPRPFANSEYLAQQRVPVLWGPSYASGAALTGTLGRFDYAAEIKNASLSSRPEAWAAGGDAWRQPTYSGRVGYRPSAAWNLGFSASSGPYLMGSARTTLAPGTSRGDYREEVIGQDVAYAWHHLQIWAEVFETRFTIPRVGDARTVAYYAEVRYRFSASWSGAVRWNQQLFGTIPDGAGGSVRWGRDTWRLDVAPAWRLSPHLTLKVQYSYQHHPLGARASARLGAAQLVLRF